MNKTNRILSLIFRGLGRHRAQTRSTSHRLYSTLFYERIITPEPRPDQIRPDQTTIGMKMVSLRSSLQMTLNGIGYWLLSDKVPG